MKYLISGFARAINRERWDITWAIPIEHAVEVLYHIDRAQCGIELPWDDETYTQPMGIDLSMTVSHVIRCPCIVFVPTRVNVINLVHYFK